MICKFFVETGYWVTLKVERGVYGGEEEGGWRVLLFEQTCRFSVRRPLPWRRLRCHGDASIAGMLSPAWFRSPPGDFARKYGHEKSILNRRPIGFFLFSLSLSLSLSFSLFCRRDTVVFSSVLFDWSLLRHCFSFGVEWVLPRDSRCVLFDLSVRGEWWNRGFIFLSFFLFSKTDGTVVWVSGTLFVGWPLEDEPTGLENLCKKTSAVDISTDCVKVNLAWHQSWIPKIVKYLFKSWLLISPNLIEPNLNLSYLS